MGRSAANRDDPESARTLAWDSCLARVAARARAATRRRRRWAGAILLRRVDPEVSSKHIAKRRRRLISCAVCAVLFGLLAASSLVLFATDAGRPDGESRVLAIISPVLLLTFVILLVACYAMHLDLGERQDEGQDDEDGPGGGGNGDDEDPSSGGGVDVDWERFEAEFRAYEQSLRVPA